MNMLLAAPGGGSITSYKTQNGSYIPELELLPFVVGQTISVLVAVADLTGPTIGSWGTQLCCGCGTGGRSGCCASGKLPFQRDGWRRRLPVQCWAEDCRGCNFRRRPQVCLSGLGGIGRY